MKHSSRMIRIQVPLLKITVLVLLSEPTTKCPHDIRRGGRTENPGGRFPFPQSLHYKSVPPLTHIPTASIPRASFQLLKTGSGIITSQFRYRLEQAIPKYSTAHRLYNEAISLIKAPTFNELSQMCCKFKPTVTNLRTLCNLDVCRSV